MIPYKYQWEKQLFGFTSIGWYLVLYVLQELLKVKKQEQFCARNCGVSLLMYFTLQCNCLKYSQSVSLIYLFIWVHWSVFYNDFQFYFGIFCCIEQCLWCWIYDMIFLVRIWALHEHFKHIVFFTFSNPRNWLKHNYGLLDVGFYFYYFFVSVYHVEQMLVFLWLKVQFAILSSIWLVYCHWKVILLFKMFFETWCLWAGDTNFHKMRKTFSI